MAIYKFQGRKPMPLELQKLEAGGGKYRNHRPINEDQHPIPPEPDKPHALPSHPRGLLKGLALREFRRVGHLLMKMRVLTDADHATMELYASSYANWVDYTTKMQASPLVKDGDSVRLSPFVSLAQNEYAKWRAAASELGLTPASRSRIVVEPRAKKGKGDELLS